MFLAANDEKPRYKADARKAAKATADDCGAYFNEGCPIYLQIIDLPRSGIIGCIS